MNKATLVNRAELLGLKRIKSKKRDELRALVQKTAVLAGTVTYRDLEPTLMDNFETMSGKSLRRLAERYRLDSYYTKPKERAVLALTVRRNQTLAASGEPGIPKDTGVGILRAEVKKRLIPGVSDMSRQELVRIINMGADNRNMRFEIEKLGN